ncbi:MAG TPA: STAS domain-containing protein [Steroidobacteraceae bacterium]|nr:STAS domain-containing protein [Steroidobacteraceae bacterium]
MTTRRKPGKAGKKAAPGTKAAAARARATAKSAASKAAGAKSRAARHGAARAAAMKSGAKSGGAKLGAERVAATNGRAAADESASLATLPTDCTIAQAADMKANLARMLAKPAAVTLDLSAVRRIDTAALQVLTAFIRERRGAGRDVECRGASDAFLATADVLGLRALFSPVTDDRLAEGAAGNA